MRDEMDDLVMIAASYWGGSWPEPIRLLMQTHAALDPAVREMRDDADRLGGALLESLAPAQMGEGCLASALAAIDGVEAEREAARAPYRTAAKAASSALDEVLALPEPARTSTLHAFERSDWRFAGRGVKRIELAREGDVKAELYRIEPGCGAPEHGHKGEEYTLVLTGAFHDGKKRFARGDLSVAGPDYEHKPIAEPGEVCYALAVTNAPLEFKGALGLAQRVFGLN